jgi:hypothetical protein
MSSSLFANVLQQNKPPPKAGRKYEAGAAGVPGATGADPLADMPGDDTVPRVSQEGESKYSSGVRGQVQRGGARGGRSNRQVTPTGSPERFSGVHSTPDRMTGNQPSDLADLQDLGVGGAGGEDLNRRAAATEPAPPARLAKAARPRWRTVRAAARRSSAGRRQVAASPAACRKRATA